jgi:transposase
MLNFRVKLWGAQRRELEGELVGARQAGDLLRTHRALAILALEEGFVVSEVAAMLRVTRQAVRGWLKRYLVKGARGLRTKKSPGRPPTLTKTQRRKLCELIDAGPAQAGLLGNCWRSPMIQHLIHEHFGVFYCVRYISELLKSLGYSYQKARFVSDHLDPDARERWLSRTGPHILELPRRKNAYLLFGDEASFPQWGTLSYTWARKGEQPTIETSGKRKGYKVFGLMEYFTGRFFFKCQDVRLTSQSYAAYLKEVLSRTRKQAHCAHSGWRQVPHERRYAGLFRGAQRPPDRLSAALLLARLQPYREALEEGQREGHAPALLSKLRGTQRQGPRDTVVLRQRLGRRSYLSWGCTKPKRKTPH